MFYHIHKVIFYTKMSLPMRRMHSTQSFLIRIVHCHWNEMTSFRIHKIFHWNFFSFENMNHLKNKITFKLFSLNRNTTVLSRKSQSSAKLEQILRNVNEINTNRRREILIVQKSWVIFQDFLQHSVSAL